MGQICNLVLEFNGLVSNRVNRRIDPIYFNKAVNLYPSDFSVFPAWDFIALSHLQIIFKDFKSYAVEILSLVYE